ncbi:MAG TPA: hypothetical protein VF292_02795 [Rhodanobacteraceae bacterium]
MTDTDIRAIANAAWEAGFIEACRWFRGVTQDVDSPAARKSRDAQVDNAIAGHAAVRGTAPPGRK